MRSGVGIPRTQRLQELQMLLIKASRPNLSTSCYSTGGNNSLLAFSNSSRVQESKYSQRKKNKEERKRKAPYMDVWVWVPILSTPGKLSRVSTILQVYTLTYTVLLGGDISSRNDYKPSVRPRHSKSIYGFKVNPTLFRTACSLL